MQPVAFCPPPERTFAGPNKQINKAGHEIATIDAFVGIHLREMRAPVDSVSVFEKSLRTEDSIYPGIIALAVVVSISTRDKSHDTRVYSDTIPRNAAARPSSGLIKSRRSMHGSIDSDSRPVH